VLMLSYVPSMIGVVSLVVWAVTVGMFGAVVSRVTVMGVEGMLVLPAWSVAVAVMVMVPSCSVVRLASLVSRVHMPVVSFAVVCLVRVLLLRSVKVRSMVALGSAVPVTITFAASVALIISSCGGLLIVGGAGLVVSMVMGNGSEGSEV